MDRLKSITKQSMRRWYTTGKERAGDFNPRMNRITQEFISTRNLIHVEFPLPELTKELKKTLERQASYLDTWTVDPFNYLDSIVRSRDLISQGRLRDWKSNRLKPGYE